MLMGWLQNWYEQRLIRRSRFRDADWPEAFARLPMLSRLNEADRLALRRLAILFLHRKVIEGTQGLTITDPMRLHIALQACLPILRLGLEWYDGWTEVLVYPGGFRPRRTIIDEYGIEHDVRESLSGEAWQQGPLILAWDAASSAGYIDGHNLIIHEFAHKLDMQNGVANGFPPLHRHMSRSAWQHDFSTAYADFQRRCDHHETLGIDCYAASDPAEFFAVCSEVFFETPQILQEHYPGVYAQLVLFYRQDPAVTSS